MEWKILLYARRKEPLDIPDDLSKYPMNDFELDYWRIVNSAPFRRLQDKTQVFPLDKSDFVRTRLTHSMETSALAKQLATMITANIRKNKSGTPYAMTEDEATGRGQRRHVRRTASRHRQSALRPLRRGGHRRLVQEPPGPSEATRAGPCPSGWTAR